MAVSPFVRFRGVWNSTFEGGKSGITTLYYAPEQLRSGRKSVAWVHAKRPPRQRVRSSRLMLIWLLQQAPIGSVKRCPDRRFRRQYTNFKPTSPQTRLASSTWRPVAGPMASSVLDADIDEPMNW